MTLRAPGEAHWRVLLRARAIETQCYVVAAAQVRAPPAASPCRGYTSGGQAGVHNPPHPRASYGHSLVVDPWGDVVAEAPRAVVAGREGEECVLVAELDMGRVAAVRRGMPVMEHRRLALLPKRAAAL
jgi:predicted amidohydrolase